MGLSDTFTTIESGYIKHKPVSLHKLSCSIKVLCFIFTTRKRIIHLDVQTTYNTRVGVCKTITCSTSLVGLYSLFIHPDLF